MRTYLIVATGLSVIAVLLMTRMGRAADSWGVRNEQLLTVKGKVVDLTCAITHECVPDCGAGARQLGLETADGKLYVAAKSNAIFAGLTHDLAAYCGTEIIADGLTTSNYGTTLLMIQQFKLSETADWISTDQFSTDWAKQHNTTPDAELTQKWFRSDREVERAVLLHGITGLDR